MPRGPKSLTAVRLLTAVSVALAIMCAVLAWAWTRAREEAACWRLAAEFQLPLDEGCDRS